MRQADGVSDAERALAKLTVRLKVTGTRDDGYHLLDAEMVTLDLADELTFSTGDSLTVDGPASAGVPAGDGNLVRRALRAIGRTAAVHLHKNIPAEGGLGGGSADAAAVLRWAGCTDLTVAASLGADVPFCIVGGRARVRGIGEQIEPLPFLARSFTLCTPPFGVSTVAVFRAWDDLGGPVAQGPNDLEAAAMAVEPRLAEWRDRLAEATGAVPVLAGSGSTWFVEGAYEGLAAALAPATVVVTRTDRPSQATGGRWRRASPSGGLLVAALEPRALQHLLVLLLPHALPALLDQRTHKAFEASRATGRRESRPGGSSSQESSTSNSS
jgi:4-diphosphocytidyl-2-C-methyl-D-erythritol kinase